MDFSAVIEARRSVRKFNQDSEFDHHKVQRAIDLALLSPNSSNMQLWEFHRVIDPQKRKLLAHFCMGQNAATTARELVVITITPQKWKERAKRNAQVVRDNFQSQSPQRAARAFQYYEKLIPFLYRNDRFGIFGRLRQILCFFLGLKKPIVRQVSKADLRVCLHKTAGIAAMTFMAAMKDQGYDTCPMEGFDSKRVKKLLGLAKQTEICMVIGCGEGVPEGTYAPRDRVPNQEVVFTH
ncbi:Putative NAD(P)H nitroreductase MhqN [Vibrio stylophorae]|uniref:NAD(P)H nitroreductase MhqN n=1 Tax=Vibrio stylophorae TaxID=659351 RepID=A0ABM8ZX68_9VIBR|nr:nitroreductase family protein [Vibrio stylophorae]CAH0535240.1 Putative NAD(P)H nitroreductase MhqN [Vibrio stylophorae]